MFGGSGKRGQCENIEKKQTKQAMKVVCFYWTSLIFMSRVLR
jgi:hypothetical protein